MQNIGVEWRDEVPVVKPHRCLASVDMVAPRGGVEAGDERGDGLAAPSGGERMTMPM